MSNDLKQLISDLDETNAIQVMKDRIASGEDPMAILADCREGMNLVGKRYEGGEYFVSDLMMAGEIFRQVSELLAPALQGKATASKGTVIVGTVQGDIHNIGKNLVVSLLRASGFDVRDLGVDVPSQKFVDELRATNAKVLGLSGLVTISYDGMKATIEAIKAAGLRDKVFIVIGGGIVNDEVCKYTGADAWGKDASEAVLLFNKQIAD